MCSTLAKYKNIKFIMFEPEASDKRRGDQLQQRENSRVRRAIDRCAIDRRRAIE
jgi:hypothetical protein